MRIRRARKLFRQVSSAERAHTSFRRWARKTFTPTDLDSPVGKLVQVLVGWAR